MLLFLFFSPVKCHLFNNNLLLNISLGIINARTVVTCGISINIYSSFNLTQIISCSQVLIQEKTIQLINMNIFIENNDIHLSSQLISPPELMIKLDNNSFIHSSYSTQIDTYYLSFSSELICRFSFSKNTTICFYYPSSIDFIQLEHHFDTITNTSLILPIHIRKRLININIIIFIFIIILCLFGLYILCTNRLPYDHMIQLDYIIDPQLAKRAALNLGPEPV